MEKIKKEPAVLITTILTFGILVYFVAYPVYAVFRESVMNEAGNFIGLDNYANFIKSEYFRQVLYNTLLISGIATSRRCSSTVITMISSATRSR